jgi:hypothetical protein
MPPEEFLRELVALALPFVEAWADPEVPKRRDGQVPRGLGTQAEYQKLVRLMREEASKQQHHT